jgi:hypothetical protein
MAMSAAVTVPCLLLHYPTHLPLGLVPLTLILATVAADAGTAKIEIGAIPLRWIAAAALVIVAGLIGWGQLRRMGIDVWRAGLDARSAMAQRATDADRRKQAADAVARDVLRLIERLPAEAPWLWRVVGKAQMIGGDPRSAEQSFETAYALWPHAEAEFGIGLAQAGQGRRSEALVHLGRVCRVNPSLRKLIGDDSLADSVKAMLRSKTR